MKIEWLHGGGEYCEPFDIARIRRGAMLALESAAGHYLNADECGRVAAVLNGARR
jgi:hypothetical protein